MRVRAGLVQHLDLGWHKRQPDPVLALEDVKSVRLLTGREMRRLFPGARFENERVLLVTKSFIALQGWGLAET